MTKPPNRLDDRPWWHCPEVWLVIAGPLVVVIAAIATAVLAFQNDDLIMNDQHPPSLNAVQLKSLMPEQLAKSHAGVPFDIELFKKTKQAAMEHDPDPAQNPSAPNTDAHPRALQP